MDQSIPRANAKRLLQGGGACVDGLRVARLAHVAFFHSPHAHARIVNTGDTRHD
jgi:carbon-monoxide dehydrogenase large subunit